MKLNVKNKLPKLYEIKQFDELILKTEK